MKLKITPIIIILFFLIIFIIFFKGLKNSNIYTPNTKTQINIPEFQAKNFENNKTINSKDIFLDDKFYLLNIWASWCLPCKKEHPLLMNLGKFDQLEIIGLNYKDNLKNAENFLKELGNPYKEIFIDLDGIIAIEWGAYGVPESFLIYNNEIIKKYIGPLNQQLIDEINLLIK